jgi:hypothetical protein
LVILSLFLVLGAPLLQLLDGQFKFLLRLDQVSLVIVLLSLEEHDLAFPECLVTVVIRLEVLELTLRLLKGSFDLHKIFSLHRSQLVCVVSTVIQISQLIREIVDLLLGRGLQFILFLLKLGHLSLKNSLLSLKLGVFLAKSHFKVLKRLSLLLVLLFPELLLTCDPIDLRVAVVLNFSPHLL